MHYKKTNTCFWAMVVFIISSCNSTKKLTEMSLTDSDFVITSETPWENTLIAIAPGENNNALLGKLVLSGGSTNSMYSRPLFNGNSTASIDINSSATVINLPSQQFIYISTDNQIVKLKNGNLLAVHSGSTWSPISGRPPSWGNEKDIEYEGQIHEGQRLAMSFYISKDAGLSWQYYSIIDFGRTDLRKYSSLRRLSCRDTIDVPPSQQCVEIGTHYKRWFPGGPVDRVELYQCPYTGNIYVTAWGVGGVSGEPDYFSGALVFYSTDMGLTWQLLSDKILVVAPIVMTSTPDGRLFLFNGYGGIPTLYYSISDKDGMKLSQGFPVYYPNNISLQMADTISINRNLTQPISICRATEGSEKSDAVIVSYPA